MFNNGNADYLTTAGNQTINIMSLTSSGSLLSPTTSSLITSNMYCTITGSILVSSIATYYITPNITTGYMGVLSCIGLCTNGRHVSMTPVIMPTNTNIRGYVTQGSTYNFGTYTAFVEPFGGTNTTAIVSDSPSRSIQFRVTAFNGNNTVNWSLTVFSLAS
jgi:hypothetical protein